MSDHQRSPLERLEALEVWLQKTNTTLTQVNGQRKYGGPPPDWSGPAPGPRCEIFLCHLPREVYEDTLIPLCQAAGLLYEFRLMMNFSGQNRGFAYAKYATPEAARIAVRILNGSTLPCGKPLVVRLSSEKHQLVLDGVPGNLERPALIKVLEELGEGLVGLKLKTSMEGPKRERQTIALATYANHHAASMVKKIVVQAFKKQFGVTVAVSWTSSTALPLSHDQHEKRDPSPPCWSGRHAPRLPRLSLPSLPMPSPPSQSPTPPGTTRTLLKRPPGFPPNLLPSPQSCFSSSPPLIQGFHRAVGVRPDLGVMQEGGFSLAEAFGGGHAVGDGRPHGIPVLAVREHVPGDAPLQASAAVRLFPGLPAFPAEDEHPRAVPAFPMLCHIQPGADHDGGFSGLLRQGQSATALELPRNMLNPPQI